MLSLLVQHPGRVLTHQHILRELWGPKSIDHTDYLRVHVAHLRQELEPDSSRSNFLKTEPGIGYRFVNWYAERESPPLEDPASQARPVRDRHRAVPAR